MNPPPTTTTTLTTSTPPPLGLAVLTATVWTHRVNHFKRLPDPVWQIASDHSVPFPNLWLTINNKQNPRPSNCINSDTAWWETVSWMGDDLRFTAWNLLILSNWLSPVRKSSSLHQSPPPPYTPFPPPPPPSTSSQQEEEDESWQRSCHEKPISGLCLFFYGQNSIHWTQYS